MATYGNILSVFDADNALLQGVSDVLTANGADFELVDNVFYIQTKSQENTRLIILAINNLSIQPPGFRFVFFHNRNADGSIIKTGGFGTPANAHIKQLLQIQ